jgi:hypothetical protein
MLSEIRNICRVLNLHTSPLENIIKPHNCHPWFNCHEPLQAQKQHVVSTCDNHVTLWSLVFLSTTCLTNVTPYFVGRFREPILCKKMFNSSIVMTFQTYGFNILCWLFGCCLSHKCC